MKLRICGIFTRHNRHCNGDYYVSGRQPTAGNASLLPRRTGKVACSGKHQKQRCYWGCRPVVKKVFGGKWSHLKTAARQWWQYLPVGPTFVRCRTRHYAPFRNHGFSLAECLIALLILSLTVLLLSGYHQQLVYGFRMRQAQRDASWAATQVLAGKPPTGWHSELKREMTEDGCLLVTAKVQGPFNRHSELEQWFCPPFDGHLPE